MQRLLSVIRSFTAAMNHEEELTKMAKALRGGHMVHLEQGKSFHWIPTMDHRDFRSVPDGIMVGPEITLSLEVHRRGGKSFNWFPPTKEAMVYTKDEGGQKYSYIAPDHVIDQIVEKSKRLPDDNGAIYAVMYTDGKIEISKIPTK